MLLNNKIAAVTLSATAVTLLCACAVSPSNNGSQHGATNGSYQQANQKSASSEWDRGCGDAKNGGYDRSGNAGPDYEQGWNACKNGNNQSQSSAQIGQTPPVAQDLVGARAAGALDELEKRGLKYVRTEEYGDGKFSYWKELGTGGCVAVRTTQGKIETATYTETTQCN